MWILEFCEELFFWVIFVYLVCCGGAADGLSCFLTDFDEFEAEIKDLNR